MSKNGLQGSKYMSTNFHACTSNPVIFYNVTCILSYGHYNLTDTTHFHLTLFTAGSTDPVQLSFGTQTSSTNGSVNH